MASALTQADMDMLKVCMKVQGKVKPDFVLIAAELGCTQNQAYHRHYRMLRRLPELGIGAYNGGSTPSSSSVVGAIPKTPRKRGATTGKSKGVNADEDDDDIDDGSVAKKAKTANVKRTVKGKGKGKAVLKTIDESDDEDQKIVKLEGSEVDSDVGDDAATVQGEGDSGDDVSE